MKTGEAIVLNENDILRAAIRRRGTNQTELAEKLGIVPSAVSQIVGRNRMTMDKFRKMLDVMDYDIYIVDRKTKKAEWAVETEE